jgi:hypothetical protein
MTLVCTIGNRCALPEGALPQGVCAVPPSAFPMLPKAIRLDLQHRRCEIPQSPSQKLVNVIRGKFFDTVHTDWAVLCDVRSANTSMILVYRGGAAITPSVLEESRLSDRSCWMQIEATGKSEILQDYKAYGGPKPPAVIDHQGIDYGICEKASDIFYFYRGKWLKLTGSD